VPNFFEIAEKAAEIWRFFEFSNWLPSMIIYFSQYDGGLASKLMLKPLVAEGYGPYAFGVKIEAQNRVGCETCAPSQAVPS